jgi:hypothetical protein
VNAGDAFRLSTDWSGFCSVACVLRCYRADSRSWSTTRRTSCTKLSSRCGCSQSYIQSSMKMKSNHTDFVWRMWLMYVHLPERTSSGFVILMFRCETEPKSKNWTSFNACRPSKPPIRIIRFSYKFNVWYPRGSGGRPVMCLWRLNHRKSKCDIKKSPMLRSWLRNCYFVIVTYCLLAFDYLLHSDLRD